MGKPAGGEPFVALGVVQTFGGRFTVGARYKGPAFGDLTSHAGALSIRVAF
ncbi:MAG: hypothetical protein WDM92_13455 [Caulobacteraceae bacterium]